MEKKYEKNTQKPVHKNNSKQKHPNIEAIKLIVSFVRFFLEWCPICKNNKFRAVN